MVDTSTLGCKNKIINFEVGVQRFYAVVSPEVQEHWSIQQFTSISPTNFRMRSAFADKDENPELPGSDNSWTNYRRH